MAATGSRRATHTCRSKHVEEVFLERDDIHSIVDLPDIKTFTISVGVDMQGILDRVGTDVRVFLRDLHAAIAIHPDVQMETRLRNNAKRRESGTFTGMMRSVIELMFNESPDLNMSETNCRKVSVVEEAVREELVEGGLFVGKLVSRRQFDEIESEFRQLEACRDKLSFVTGDSLLTQLRIIDGDAYHQLSDSQKVVYRIRFNIIQSTDGTSMRPTYEW